MSQEKPRFLLIVFIALSQFSSAFMHSIMGVTLPALGQELAASGVELALTESIFLATTAALLLPIGRFADATDKNTLFKGGLIGLAVMTFAIGLQPSISTVIGARFLQGVAASFLTATSMAIVADLAPRNQMGRMLGLAIGATYFGLASGPFFSGLITTHLGWRWVFFLAAVPPLLAYLLSLSTLTSRWRPPTTRINLWNSLTLAVSIMVFVAGAAMLKRAGIGISLAVLGVVIGVVFVFLERRAANPLLKIDEVIANHSLSNALSVQFLIYCGTVGTTFLLSVYLQLVRGLTPEAAGHLLVIGPVVMAIFAPLAGRVSDRISPRLITAFGAAFILCSVALAALITARSGTGLIIAIMVFQGLGFALFSAPNIALIMNSVAPTDRGMASALSAVMRSLGMVVSMFIVTALLAAQLGAGAIVDHQDDYLMVMRWTFIVFAGLTALGVFVAAGRRRRSARVQG